MIRYDALVRSRVLYYVSGADIAELRTRILTTTNIVWQ